MIAVNHFSWRFRLMARPCNEMMPPATEASRPIIACRAVGLLRPLLRQITRSIPHTPDELRFLCTKRAIRVQLSVYCRSLIEAAMANQAGESHVNALRLDLTGA